MIKFDVLSESKGKRSVKVRLRLKNAVAVEMDGMESGFYEASFKSQTEWERFKEICSNPCVTSLGYCTHKYSYAQYVMKDKWVECPRVAYPTFVINDCCMVIVKSKTLGRQSNLLGQWLSAKAKYKAMKASHEEARLFFLYDEGARVTEQGELLKDWLEEVSMEGGTEFDGQWLKYSSLYAERARGQVIRTVALN